MMEDRISSMTEGNLIDEDWFKDDFKSWLDQYEQLGEPEPAEKTVGKTPDEDSATQRLPRGDCFIKEEEPSVQEMDLSTVTRQENLMSPSLAQQESVFPTLLIVTSVANKGNSAASFLKVMAKNPSEKTQL